MADTLLLYSEHRVFCRKSSELVLFVCLERISDGKFAVNQAEFIRVGDRLSERSAQIAATTVELLLDDERLEQLEFFDAIDEAIAAHEHAFADMEEWLPNA